MRLIFMFLLISSFGFSQENTLIADYTFSTKFKELPQPTKVNSRLVTDGFFSNYEMDFVGNLNFMEEEAGEDGGSVLAIKTKKNPIIYKDSKSRHIYSIERIGMKPFLVKDSMNIFNWAVKDVKKEILGYSCQQATVTYRGRNYTAYFTSEIPFQTGPWKFYGLPGLIMQVESDDGVLKILANKINIRKEKNIIKNPFTDIELQPITWNDYIKEYEKKYSELNNFRGQNGSRISIPKRLIETLISYKFLFSKN